MRFELLIDKNMTWLHGKDLAIQLVPYLGDPSIYVDLAPFSDKKPLKDYKWISEELADDNIVVPAKDLNDASSI